MLAPARRMLREKTSSYCGPGGALMIYRAADGTVELDVRLERESLWLSQKQMAVLFDKDQDTIGLHLRNIFKECELDEKATTEDSSVVQEEGGRRVRRSVRFYNLDAIISVGYRVNSKRGTQFRVWATCVLRDHILKGFTVNQARLRELNQAVRLIAHTVERRDLSGDEAKVVLRVVAEYSHALDLLDDFDHQRVRLPRTSGKVIHVLGYDEALRIVGQLRTRFAASKVFGVEKDKGLASALGAVMQTFDGKDLYPSLGRKPHTCSTSSSRTTPSWTATSGLLLHCSCGSSNATACFSPRPANV